MIRMRNELHSFSFDRRDEEKERQEKQQREEERKRRQMQNQNIQKRRTSHGITGRGHGQGQVYAPVVAGHDWPPGFDATPQAGFGDMDQNPNTAFGAFPEETPFPDLNGQYSTPGQF